jgi:hypothetical protein
VIPCPHENGQALSRPLHVYDLTAPLGKTLFPDLQEIGQIEFVERARIRDPHRNDPTELVEAGFAGKALIAVLRDNALMILGPRDKALTPPQTIPEDAETTVVVGQEESKGKNFLDCFLNPSLGFHIPSWAHSSSCATPNKSSQLPANDQPNLYPPDLLSPPLLFHISHEIHPHPSCGSPQDPRYGQNPRKQEMQWGLSPVSRPLNS